MSSGIPNGQGRRFGRRQKKRHQTSPLASGDQADRAIHSQRRIRIRQSRYHSRGKVSALSAPTCSLSSIIMMALSFTSVGLVMSSLLQCSEEPRGCQRIAGSASQPEGVRRRLSGSALWMTTCRVTRAQTGPHRVERGLDREGDGGVEHCGALSSRSLCYTTSPHTRLTHQCRGSAQQRAAQRPTGVRISWGPVERA